MWMELEVMNMDVFEANYPCLNGWETAVREKGDLSGNVRIVKIIFIYLKKKTRSSISIASTKLAKD